MKQNRFHGANLVRNGEEVYMMGLWEALLVWLTVLPPEKTMAGGPADLHLPGKHFILPWLYQFAFCDHQRAVFHFPNPAFLLKLEPKSINR
jgi:hypothetical protein